MDPAVAHELAPTPLGYGPQDPGEHCLRQSPIDKMPLWKFGFSVQKFQYTNEAKKNISFDASKRVGTIQYQVRPSLPEISYRGKMRAWECVLIFPICVGHCQRDQFLSHLIQSTKSWGSWWGVGRGWERGRQDSQRALEGYRSQLCHRLHLEAHSRDPGDTLSTDHLKWLTDSPSAPCTSPIHCSKAGFVCKLLTVASMSFGTHLVNMHRKSTWVYGPGRNHKLELNSTLGKAQGRLPAIPKTWRSDIYPIKNSKWLFWGTSKRQCRKSRKQYIIQTKSLTKRYKSRNNQTEIMELKNTVNAKTY